MCSPNLALFGSYLVELDVLKYSKTDVFHGVFVARVSRKIELCASLFRVLSRCALAPSVDSRMDEKLIFFIVSSLKLNIFEQIKKNLKAITIPRVLITQNIKNTLRILGYLK